MISKVTAGIGDISDEELLSVIKDYNITRNGTRQLYIFLEEAIKLRYIKYHDKQSNRATI